MSDATVNAWMDVVLCAAFNIDFRSKWNLATGLQWNCRLMQYIFSALACSETLVHIQVDRYDVTPERDIHRCPLLASTSCDCEAPGLAFKDMQVISCLLKTLHLVLCWYCFPCFCSTLQMSARTCMCISSAGATHAKPVLLLGWWSWSFAKAGLLFKYLGAFIDQLLPASRKVQGISNMPSSRHMPDTYLARCRP